MNLQQYNQAKKELKENPNLIHDKDFNVIQLARRCVPKHRRTQKLIKL